MLAFRPPVHSSWATFLPASSADEATDCASRTFVGSVPGLAPLPWNANDVEVVNTCRLSKKVLLVLPCTPGPAPVASVYQPCPVFGGKPWVSPLSPVAPDRMSEAYVGMTPCAAYRCMRSGRIPSELYRTTGVLCEVAGGE